MATTNGTSALTAAQISKLSTHLAQQALLNTSPVMPSLAGGYGGTTAANPTTSPYTVPLVQPRSAQEQEELSEAARTGLLIDAEIERRTAMCVAVAIGARIPEGALNSQAQQANSFEEMSLRELQRAIESRIHHIIETQVNARLAQLATTGLTGTITNDIATDSHRWSLRQKAIDSPPQSWREKYGI